MQPSKPESLTCTCLAGGTRMGNCVVPKSLCGGIPLNSSLLHCPPHLLLSACWDRRELTSKEHPRPSGSTLSTDSETESRERKLLIQDTQLPEENNIGKMYSGAPEMPARAHIRLPRPQPHIHGEQLPCQGARIKTRVRTQSGRHLTCLPVLAGSRMVDLVLCISGKGCLWGPDGGYKLIMTILSRLG